MEVGNGFDPESATKNVDPTKNHTSFQSGSIGVYTQILTAPWHPMGLAIFGCRTKALGVN
jgi:hypothetical protein